ncbi:MAG: VanZ family protein [Lachnospiraceae bacterium]
MMIGYIKETGMYVAIGLLVWLVYILIVELKLWLDKSQISWVERVALLTLGMYLIVIFAVTISPIYGWNGRINWQTVNFIPGQVLKEVGGNPLNFFGNVCMFVPLGFLVPLVSHWFHEGQRTIFIGTMVSLGIECIQLFSGRGTDVDDVILNTFGALIGFIIFYILGRWVPDIKSITGIRRKNHTKKFCKDQFLVYLLIVAMCVSVMGTGGYERGKEKVIAPLDAGQVSVMHAKSGRDIYGINPNAKIAPASTAKLLTALVVTKYCKPNEETTVGEELNRVAVDSSRAGLKKGNVLTVKQLLEGLLLPSGNDAAYTLAVYTGRKIAQNSSISFTEAVEIFTGEMNKQAKKIGANQSCFVNPDGYDAQGQYTNARDLSYIAKEFLDAKIGNVPLADIVKERSIREQFIDGTDVTWTNTNELLNPSGAYYLKEAIGLKTGSSEQAGNCLVSAAYVGKELYIVVVMGDTKTGRYIDTLKIYEMIKGM